MIAKSVEVRTTTDWPLADLEWVSACPVCRATGRHPMHAGLTDGVFGSAPGRWQMWRCTRCWTGYLSPRPTSDSVMRAYATYYTHRSVEATSRPVNWRDRLENGYVNSRYGAKRVPASRLGPWVFQLLPIRRSAIDRSYRHLPRRLHAARLLDVGCGDGAFLAIARDCGWTVTGVEPDPVAAALARGRGLEVRLGGIETLHDEVRKFDVITLSHVIEHVHAPIQLLSSCYSLLRPGGWLWIETPNLESEGHRLFGRHWRGLEAPRHLVIFNRRSLESALRAAGFSSVRDEPVPSSRGALFRESEAIRRGAQPGLESTLLMRLPHHLAQSIRRSHIVESWFGAPREFLTCSARRLG